MKTREINWITYLIAEDLRKFMGEGEGERLLPGLNGAKI